MGKLFAKRATRDADDLDIVSAIWILASNDDNPAISYAGLRHRLRLPTEGDVRTLVARRGELFRLTIPETRLSELKATYQDDKQLPSWLREVPKGPARTAAIEALTVNDFFRSQFRAEPSAVRSPIEVVDWGLQHIERLRKAATDARDAPLKRWSTLWVPLLSVLVASGAVFGSLYVQRKAAIDQRDLKQYEVSFRPKSDGYTRFMQSVSVGYYRASLGNRSASLQSLDDAELALIQLEPFLKLDARQRVREQFQRFVGFCQSVQRAAQPGVESADSTTVSFISQRDQLSNALYAALFQ